MEKKKINLPKYGHNEQDLQRLLCFYLACIEEEDLRSLTLRLSQLHRSFLSPWEELEPLFGPAVSEISFETKYKSDRSLLLRGVIETGEPTRLFYGYPIFLDEEDQISPLFFTEVEVRRVEDNRFLLRPINPEEIHFNHHFLRRQHAEVEEIQAIQEGLEGPFGSFDARLKVAFEYLAIPFPGWGRKLDPFPDRETPKNSWYNHPILFRSERSSYTVHVRRELNALGKYHRFLESVAETALGTLLFSQSTSEKESSSVWGKEVIEVRPLNVKQELALQLGLEAPLTVVTGPPGTGKSQVVVNLLANAVIGKKSVLFASKNNKAVDVVREWLQEILGLDQDWTFRVGSRDRMNEEQAEMINRLVKLPKSRKKTSSLNLDRISELDQQIKSIRSQIENISEKLDELSEAIERERRAEALVPKTWILATLEKMEASFDKNWIDQQRRETQAFAQGSGLGLWLWFLKFIFGSRLLDKYFTKLKMAIVQLPVVIQSDLESISNIGLAWQNLAEAYQKLSNYMYWLSCRKVTQNINGQIIKLEEANVLIEKLNKLKEVKTFISQDQLRRFWTNQIALALGTVHHLIRRYFDLSLKLRQVRGKEAWLTLRNDFEDTCYSLFQFFPAWIVTNLSTGRALPLKENLFDLVIIDEASQCDVPSAFPLLFRAKRAVIIGDPHQLRHISTLNQTQESQIAEMEGATKLLADWSYTSKSLYDVAEAAIIHSGGNPIFLAEHYRSHPDIIEFSNFTFYGNSLVLRTKIPILAKRLGKLDLGLFWHDIQGKVPETVRSAYNEEEIKKIIQTLTRWEKAGLLDQSELTLGIVTPFRLQMERIEDAVQNQPWFKKLKDRIRVGTAHRFQGDEADLVIFSPVVSDGIRPRTARWVAETDQLLNVAITRARGALHIFGNTEACLKAGRFLGGFAEYAVNSKRDNSIKTNFFESPAEEKLAELLNSAGLWYHPQYKVGRYKLDFFIVSPFGMRYDLEVDGRQHWSAEQFNYDEVRDKTLEEAGYQIIRINAKDILKEPKKVQTLLRRLV